MAGVQRPVKCFIASPTNLFTAVGVAFWIRMLEMISEKQHWWHCRVYEIAVVK